MACRQAVDLISFSVPWTDQEITTLLGSNGAGKTTLNSVLTGLYPATSGTVRICGLDVRTDMDQIKQFLSVCPQQNSLFDWMTVEEHVILCSKLRRGISYKLSTGDHEILQDVGLLDKKDTYARSLSGGMKRKLCLAMAYVGSPKVRVIMMICRSPWHDVCTSGVSSTVAGRVLFGERNGVSSTVAGRVLFGERNGGLRRS